MRLLAKVALVVLLSSGMIMAVCVVLLLQTTRHEQVARSLSELSSEVTGLMPLLGRAVWNLDQDNIRDSLASLAERPDIGSVTLWDESGRLLQHVAAHEARAASESPFTARNILPDAGRTPFRAPAESRQASLCCGSSETSEYVVGTLWENQGASGPLFLGHVVVRVAPEVLEAAAVRGRNQILLVAAALELCVLLVLVFFLRNTVVIPIRRLAEASHAATIERLSTVPELRGNDELAMLTRCFNAMVLRLRSQRVSLGKKEEDLRNARDAAEAASRAKSSFLANMSHEIRTPMNGIIGMAELLARSELTEKQSEYVGMILSSSDALLSVINNVLDLSKIEAGKLSLQREPFSVEELLSQVSASLRMTALQKGLEFNVRLADGLAERYVGDRNKIRQVLLNLVSNAVKFTPSGNVTVEVEETLSGGGRALVRFLVRDTGVGIPKDRHDFIFQEFTQIDGTLTKKYQGTGLGLAISRRLVEVMGGTLGLESVPGTGSTFEFTLPLGVSATPPT